MNSKFAAGPLLGWTAGPVAGTWAAPVPALQLLFVGRPNVAASRGPMDCRAEGGSQRVGNRRTQQ